MRRLYNLCEESYVFLPYASIKNYPCYPYIGGCVPSHAPGRNQKAIKIVLICSECYHYTIISFHSSSLPN